MVYATDLIKMWLMTADKKVDLRIQRTKDSIRKTFEEMICEMDYEQISIKELAQRARINRKNILFTL